MIFQVLNALRHQRFDHEAAQEIATIAFECSTPYGIRGLITNPVEIQKAIANRAQRLTASEV